MTPLDRLAIRYERRADIHEAFLTPGCSLICFRFLQNARREQLQAASESNNSERSEHAGERSSA